MSFSDFSFWICLGTFSLSSTKISSAIHSLCYIYSKLQTFALSLIFTLKFVETSDSPAANVLRRISNAIYAGELTDSYSWILFVYISIQAYSYITLILCIWVSLCIYAKKRPSGIITKLWKAATYLNGACLSFPMIGFNLNVLRAGPGEDIATLGASVKENVVLLIMCCFSLAWLSFLAYLDYQVYATPLKVGNNYSSKERLIERMDFIEKLILYLGYLFLPESRGKVWTIIILNFLFSALRIFLIFKRLPYYKIGLLKCELVLSSAQMTLTTLNFVGLAIYKEHEVILHSFLLITWVLFIPLSAKIVLSAYKHLAEKIFSERSNLSPTYLFHKIILYKYSLRKKVPTHHSHQTLSYEEMYLSGHAHNLFVRYQDTNERIRFNFDDLTHFRGFMKASLLEASRKHPKLISFKLAYVKFLLKHSKNYLEVAHILQGLKKKDLRSGVEVSICYLETVLETKLLQSHEDILKTNDLDMAGYIELNEKFEQLKDKIIKQAHNHLKFWTEFMSTEINFKAMFDLSLKIAAQKEDIAKFWKQIEMLNKKNFIIPYITYGIYLKIVNNMPSTSLKYLNGQLLALARIELNNHIDELDNNTLFYSDNIHVTISGTKENLGKVLSCSESCAKVFGFPREKIMGSNIDMLMSPFFRERHDAYLIRYFKTGEQKIFKL